MYVIMYIIYVFMYIRSICTMYSTYQCADTLKRVYTHANIYQHA